MKSAQHAGYRPDIDGLRAVAVLSVIGFHAFPRVVPGGFIGVDIFFVISGFLISGIIYNGLRRDRFSYLDFYARRVRRIFPALLTVLTACLVGGWFLLLPDEYKQLGGQLAAGAGFASNLLLWSQAGYFDSNSAIKPLLHLWSLGIEEQFYLVWPLFIAFFYRRTRYLAVVVAGLMLASFVWNIAFIHGSPTATYYLPMARFWELLVGALLSYAMIFGGAGPIYALIQRPPETNRSAAQKAASAALCWCGLLLIGASLSLITTQSAFPGWWALLPSVGALFIIAARDSWPNRVVLSNRVLVSIGLISYPLYLWHWVLLAFLRSRVYWDGGEVSRPERIAAVALSFLFAWLTFALIEKPIRFGANKVFRPVVLVALMAFVGALGFAVDLTDGAVFRYPREFRSLGAFQYDADRKYYQGQYRFEECFLSAAQSYADLDAKCIDPPDGKSRLIVLWGDSHAASLYPALKAKQDREGGFRIAQFTAASCPPVVGMQIQSVPSCKAFNDAVAQQITSLRPDIVLMEGDWALYDGTLGRPVLDLPALIKSVNNLTTTGVGHVVVFGDLPKWTVNEPQVAMRIWRQSHTTTRRTFAFFNHNSASRNAAVKKAIGATSAVFVSPMDLFCNTQGCLLSTDPVQMLPVAWDDAHLTLAASQMLIGFASADIFGQ
jgi:peptidoglycan/LPS O-acetylase OafA/YrhL